METLKDYIKNYKNISFEEYPFNDIDNAIFSLIVYLDFDNIVKEPITIKEAGKYYFEKINNKQMKKEYNVIKKANEVFELIYLSIRYRNIILSNYIKIVDKEKQFCALKFKSKKFTYIAYEGTDASIVGWKEDMEMFYKFPITSQKLAINYLNEVIKKDDKNVIVGGHSKGGNLAMTAAMYTKFLNRIKIKKIYNNDGPGFTREILNSFEYKIMKRKLTMFIPEESVVSLLLDHDVKYHVVKSNAISFFQHNPITWLCNNTTFVEGKMKKSSKLFKRNLTNWLNEHDLKTRKKIVETVYDIFNKCEIISIMQIKKSGLSSLLKIINQSKTIDTETKDLLKELFKMIIFKDIVKDEVYEK